MNDRTMSESSTLSPAPTPPRRAGNAVLCPACERLNPLGSETCDRCAQPLFAECRHCGARNPRTCTRCTRCGRNQGKVRRNASGSRWHSPSFWAVLVAGIGILLALGLLFWVGGGRLPRI